VAHTTQADAPRTLAELQAARPAALWEYRTTDTQKNPPAHLHIPAAVAQLGIVLDLTTQTDATRTTWDREVSGMLMCSDADAMSRRAGSAALYLLRTERRENPPKTYTDTPIQVWVHGSDGVDRVAGITTSHRPDSSYEPHKWIASTYDGTFLGKFHHRQDAKQAVIKWYESNHRDDKRSQNPPNAKRKSRQIPDPEMRAARASIYAGSEEMGTVEKQRWIDDDGSERERYHAIAWDGTPLQAHPEDTHATPYEQTFFSRMEAITALGAYYREHPRPSRDTNQRAKNPDEVSAYLQGSRDAQAGKPARMPKDPTLAAAYRQGYEDAADDKRDQKWEEFWGGAAPTREPNAFPKREGVGSGAAQSTSARAYMLTLANLKTSATLRTIAERIHRDDPAIEIDEVIAALRDLEAQGLVKREGPTYRRSTADESKPSRHRNHHDGETADAAATFEAWHRREPSHVDTLDNLPDVIGVYIGRATRIGYRSDKWGKKGHAQDYDHDYTEPGYSPPEVWADRADLDQAHAIVIVGGNQRITPEGID
jgi:hypothetical protein